MKFPKKFRGANTNLVVEFTNYTEGKVIVPNWHYDVGYTTVNWLNCLDHALWIPLEDDDSMIEATGSPEAFAEKWKTASESVSDIQSDRENDYGNAEISMTSIGVFWGEYLSRKMGHPIEIDATDVAQMMVLFKINRNAYKRKLDNALDLAAYADFTLQFEKEIE